MSDQGGTNTPGSTDDAQIFDRGHRRYTGPRSGLMGAARSLVVHTARSVLGLGRPARHKVIPVVVIVMSYLPAVAFVGTAALIPENLRDEGILPGYAEYYGFVIAALYLFAALMAPQILSEDRRTGMLGIYLASPLDRRSYLVAKAVTAFGLISVVTLGPPLLMLVAYSLESAGPDGFGRWLSVLVKIVLSSAVIGLFLGAIAAAVAATTDRALVATATIALIIPGSAVVTDRLVFDARLSPVLHLLNLPGVPRELIFRIHGTPEANELGPLETQGSLWSPEDVSTWSLWLVWLAVVGGSAAFVWYRYRRLLVRR